jgi:plastocyanin
LVGKLTLAAALSVLVCLVVDCAGGSTPSGAAGGATAVIELNLTQNRPISTPFGESGGTKPAVLTVSVGDKVVFTNSDSFAHTSSSLGNFTTFPVGSPLTAKALKQTGATLSGGWTSGLLQPNSASQTILADKPGRYLYGCYFHYDAPMRGAIVVR